MESPEGRYQAADLERFVVETSETSRSEFERDRARIVHSAALRRLAAKTQVVGPVEQRLHPQPADAHASRSPRSAATSRTSLGCDRRHRRGRLPGPRPRATRRSGTTASARSTRPPRRSAGSRATPRRLRLLTRLEAKSLDDDGRSVGLNLTRAMLDAATQVPVGVRRRPRGDRAARRRAAARRPASSASTTTTATVFAWMRVGRACRAHLRRGAGHGLRRRRRLQRPRRRGRRRRRPHRADPTWPTTGPAREASGRPPATGTCPTTTSASSRRPTSGCRGVAGWPTAPYDGSRRHLAGLKNLTSRLINRFCRAVQAAVEAAGLPAPLVRYGADLPVPEPVRAEIVVLKGIAAHLVMKADDRVERTRRQRELLHELGRARLGQRRRSRRSSRCSVRTSSAADRRRAARFASSIDQVASLTDLSAVATFHKLAAAGHIGADDAVRRADCVDSAAWQAGSERTTSRSCASGRGSTRSSPRM